MFTVVCS